MLQRYSAFHTLIILVCSFVVGILGVGAGTKITTDNFDSTIGKALFAFGVMFIVLPIFINVVSMLWHMAKTSRWLWFASAMIFACYATMPYYFIVYRKHGE